MSPPLGPGIVLQGRQGGARLHAMGNSGAIAGGPVGLRVPIEWGTFSKNKHHLQSCQTYVFDKFVTSRVPNMSPARVRRWGQVLCHRGPGMRPAPCQGMFGGLLREVREQFRVPLERGTFCENKHHLVSCQNKFFCKFVTSRVPSTCPARVGRWGRVLCYGGGRE